MQAIPGISARASRWGNGIAYFVGDREVAHFHGDARLDVRLTSEGIRDLRRAGPLDPRLRTRGPTAHWAAITISGASDIPLALALLEEAVRANS